VQAEREVRGHRPRYHENEVKPPDAAACSANPEVSAEYDFRIRLRHLLVPF